MTFYTALEFIVKLGLDSKLVKVKIPAVAEEIDGTTASLTKGEILTLYDLFFALMLPSGNDAAIVIGLAIGMMIF